MSLVYDIDNKDKVYLRKDLEIINVCMLVIREKNILIGDGLLRG